jgi:hypothetical protein
VSFADGKVSWRGGIGAGRRKEEVNKRLIETNGEFSITPCISVIS